MVKLRKDTDHKDARRMGKEEVTYENGIGNVWERMRRAISQYRRLYAVWYKVAV